MRFSSVIKVEHRKNVSTFKNDFFEIIENSLAKCIPLVFNGIYLQTEVQQYLPKLDNAIWIEPYNFQINKPVLERDNPYEIISSLEFSSHLLKDIKLSKYETLILNNFHHKDPYSDLVVSNIQYIQNQRRLANLTNLKIILLTYPLPIDCLLNLFENSMIFNIDVPYSDNALNLEADVNPGNYLESVFKTIYLLFTNKLDEFNSNINATNLKVLVFLADHADSSTAYKWLNSRLVSMINAYIVLVDNNVNKKNLTSYSSLLVLTSCADKNVLHSLNVDFDYVIDCGLITVRKFHKIARVDCMNTEKIELIDSMIRSHYAKKPNGKIFQLYGTDKRFLFPSNIDFTNSLKIKHDVTDFVFCQIALGANSWESFRSTFSYLLLPLRCSVENLMKSKLIVKTNSNLPQDNSQRPKVIMTIMNYELTELGRDCLKLRPLDCRAACVLICALKNECFVSCLTLVSLLQVSDELFANLYNNESVHLKKLKTIYDGNDDLEFLIKFYRHYINLSKEDRFVFLKSFSLNKFCLTTASKIRTSIKETFPFEHNNVTKSEFITKCFVAAYPFQIAKYSPVEKLYLRPGSTKATMKIDPYSFAYNEENPTPFVFYYSAYTENENTYMKYVSPISQQIWDEFSDL